MTRPTTPAAAMLSTCTAAALCLAAAAHAGSARIAVELDTFDLETGTVDEDCALYACTDGDFEFSYNANGGNPLRFFQNQMTATVAFLDGSAYAGVGCDDLEDAQFTDLPIDEPFDADDTMLIETAKGAIYKVGDAVLNENFTVTFSYALLSCGPCRWDLNGDGNVNESDLVSVILDYGLSDTTSDVTGNGVVDVEDVIDVVLHWGSCLAD